MTRMQYPSKPEFDLSSTNHCANPICNKPIPPRKFYCNANCGEQLNILRKAALLLEHLTDEDAIIALRGQQ